MDNSQFENAINLPSRVSSSNDLDTILAHMIKVGASDIFIIGEDFIWGRVNLKMVKLTKRIITSKEAIDLLSSFYGLNASSKLGSPEPISIDLEYKETVSPMKIVRHRFRVCAAYAKKHGRLSTDITIRSIASQPPSASSIEVDESILSVCKNANQGLFLMVGSTGNGKTTTLASIIRDILEDKEANQRIVTIEEPIEYVYDDITKPSSIISQFQVGQSVASFSDGLRTSLRQDPNTILIGEARDKETIELVSEACNTGHFVLSTVHASSVLETIPRMISCFEHSSQNKIFQDLVYSMKMIVAQTLVPTTNNSKMALREWLEFTPEIKKVLSTTTDYSGAIKDMLNQYGHPMSVSAKNAFEKGRITEKTLNRILKNYGDS